MKPKFRIWNQNKKEFVQENPDDPYFFIALDGRVVHVNLRGTITVRPEFIVQQWTGCVDKNGKDVYEGDLIGGEAEMIYLMSGHKTGEKKSVVKEILWDDKHNSWSTRENNSKTNLGGINIALKFYTVIGNICETPALLK